MALNGKQYCYKSMWNNITLWNNIIYSILYKNIMWENKKKFFPKIKKKLKWFLTDESWKITKKDALWLSVWAVLLAWIEEVNAVYCSAGSVHSSWLVNWHFSTTTNCSTNSDTISQIVNWHSSHGSHGSHWSHGSHGSHWSHGSRW